MTSDQRRQMAAEAFDWKSIQHDGGPPCFYVEDAVPSNGVFPPQWRFCLRPSTWAGHCDGSYHRFVSLADVLESAYQQGQADALRWQPIETAPKDGITWVLLDWSDETVRESTPKVGFWHDLERAWCDTHEVLHGQHPTQWPTHWMPLPPAPSASQVAEPQPETQA